MSLSRVRALFPLSIHDGISRRRCPASVRFPGQESRVDEKRQGWFPNSNLGVGRVGKWAQCGVALRAFALSPSILPSFLLLLHRTLLPAFALLRLPPVTVNQRYYPVYQTTALSLSNVSNHLLPLSQIDRP